MISPEVVNALAKLTGKRYRKFPLADIKLDAVDCGKLGSVSAEEVFARIERQPRNEDQAIEAIG